MYCNHYSIIKCICFEPIQYTFDLDNVSSSRVSSEFDLIEGITGLNR